MPPKPATCSICSATVLKAQTRALPDGTRACLVHDGVAEAAEARQRAERERLAREVQTHRPKLWEMTSADHEERQAALAAEAAAFRERAYSHCWICDQEGTSLREYMFKVLIAMKRLEIRGEYNFLTFHEDVKKLLPGERALGMLPLKDAVIDKAIVKYVKDRQIRDLVPLLGCCLFCADCAVKHGFRERWMDLFPKPSMDEVMAFMPVQAMIEPVIREMAEKKERQS